MSGCPDGLFDKAEVPDGFGLLMEATPGSFEMMEEARRRPTNFDMAVDKVMPLGSGLAADNV